MGGHLGTQIKALLKKDFTIRRRALFSTLYELIVPVYFVYSLYNATQVAHGPSRSLSAQSVVVNASYITKSRIRTDFFPKRCFYTPDSPNITELIDYMNTTIGNGTIIFEYAPTEADMLEMEERTFYLEGTESSYGLIFDSSQPELNFTVRTPTQRNIRMDRMNDNDRKSETWEGFISFHWAITSYELQDMLHVQPYLDNPPWYITFDSNVFERVLKKVIEVLQSLSGIVIQAILSLANLFVLTVAARRIVTEKRRGSKELLRMMGVADGTYWLSKFLNHLWIYLIQVPIISILVHRMFRKTLLIEISLPLFMAMVSTFFISNLLLSFILTTALNRPILAVMSVIMMIFYGLIQNYKGGFSMIDLFLFPVKFLTAWLASYSEEPPPIKFPVVFLIGPIWITYILVLIYLDAVCPWQPGTVKPLNFPCKCTGKQIDVKSVSTDVDCDPKLVEKISGEPSILVSKVFKVYSKFGARKTAVENLSVQINKNQMTVLLGHNGAGKTTLMNMITGFTSPTSGVIYLNGFNVQKDTMAARRSIALCPQHECLYENLTVQENFELCANLRGTDLQIVSRTVNLLQLQNKSSVMVSKLSGGMRRRVQLGMALATDSDIIILDEPTSGLDPETRRTVWDYLISLREKKTILITTHFMEEAEALADQIIIMSGGRIKCIGSQIFLKARLGAGYCVKMGKKSFNHDLTEQLVTSMYPQAVVVSDTSEEITFSLNVERSEDQSDAFLDKIAQFCDLLDSKKDELGISSFTITTATLEDVFMKVAVDEGLVAEDRVTFAQVKDSTLAELRDVLDFNKKKGSGSFFSCYCGLISKRWNYFKRDYGFMFYSFVIPIAAIFVSSSSSQLVSEDLYKTYNFSFIEISPQFSPDGTSKPSAILSASPNSSLRECFSNINSQYNVTMIIINETIDEFLDKGKESDSGYLFGIQDQGSVENITLYGIDSQRISKVIAVNNYLNILRCVGTEEETLIQAREHAFPKRPSYKNFRERTLAERLLLFSLFPVALGFLFASTYTFPAKENQIKAELIQRMAGLGDLSYWLSNISFDMIYYTIVFGVMVTLLVIQNSNILLSFEVIASFILLFFVSFFAATSLVYLLTFSKVNPTSGFNIIVTVSSIAGFIASLIMIVFNIHPFGVGLKSFLKYKMIPSVSIIAGMDRIIWASIIVYVCDEMKDIFEHESNSSAKFSSDIKKYSLDGVKPNYVDIIKPELIMMLQLGLILFFLVLVVSKIGHRLYKCASCFMSLVTPNPRKTGHTDDEDVENERQSVISIVKDGKQSEQALVGHKLTKDFFSPPCNRFRAVDNVSFSVHKKECFGLLGVNGAGKTTTFSMLTGDTPMTTGDAYVGDLHVVSNLTKYREKVSYCPQQDALLDLLTPEETLRLFAKLRGIPGKDIPKNVDYIITTTDLTKFRQTLNCNLSGGNKRKLGLAIATVGGPEVMFLDEPTTGVDPASRRKIWATLIGLRESGRSSIVLTSHSMDECEALCNRIAIMVRGQIRCLGSSTHLKTKYGQGFTLIIKLKEESTFPSLKECVQSTFSSAKLQDQHGTTVQFHLTDPNLRWSGMFRSMILVKQKCPIDNFYIQDTSIEQIFLSFAHEEFR